MKLPLFAKKFSPKAEADILHKLALYLSAHISMSDALAMLEEEALSANKKETFANWRALIEQGKSLSQVFDEASGLEMSEVSRHAASLGERSASLAESLKEASGQIKKSLAIQKKIAGAMAYPAVIVLCTVGLVLGLILFVFPKIIPLFETLKVQLPLSTRMLIFVSRELSQNWWVFLLGLVTVGALSAALAKFSPKSVDWFRSVLLRLPVVGRVIRIRIMTSTFDSLYTLTRGGEQLASAFSLLSKTVKFSEYQEVFRLASVEITEGRSLADFFRSRKKLFPTYIFGIISVGERTGNIENSMKDIAEIAREDLDDNIKILTAALEPALMISMSLVIGFIALSIILPIYGITSHFQTV